MHDPRRRGGRVGVGLRAGPAGHAGNHAGQRFARRGQRLGLLDLDDRQRSAMREARRPHDGATREARTALTAARQRLADLIRDPDTTEAELTAAAHVVAEHLSSWAIATHRRAAASRTVLDDEQRGRVDAARGQRLRMREARCPSHGR